jgi:hypothetical protein
LSWSTELKAAVVVYLVCIAVTDTEQVQEACEYWHICNLTHMYHARMVLLLALSVADKLSV